MIQWLARAIRNAVEGRSSQWPALERKHLAEHPACAACGNTGSLAVHHIVPFHVRQDLELVESNLITLCTDGPAGVNCHCFWGHLGNWKSWNRTVRNDVGEWFAKFRKRPL